MSNVRIEQSVGFCTYLEDIAKLSSLSQDEETIPDNRICEKQRDFHDSLVKRNLQFVVSIAKKYRDMGVPLEDLVGEGNLGLIEAADRFDPDRHFKFTTYAVWWVRRSILKALREQPRTIRLPDQLERRLRTIRTERASLRQKLGREPGQEELSRRLYRRIPKIERLLAFDHREISFDSATVDGMILRLSDRFSKDSLADVEGQLIRRQQILRLEQAMLRLSRQAQRILRDRFGLGGRQRLTLGAIATRERVSREWVRQVESKALRRLRQLLTAGEVRRSDWRNLADKNGPGPPTRGRKAAPRFVEARR